MASDTIWQRSDFLGTQVITRDRGKHLGVVSDLWVDLDRREVVALGLRSNLVSRYLPGVPQYMYLNSIRQIGDVILVDDDAAIEDVDTEAYDRLVSAEVVTEDGEILGRIRGFRFDVETGKVSSLVIASFGLPLIPEQVISTYELPVEEIVSTGPQRIIVFEKAQERLVQLTVGLLERLGLGSPPWEQDADTDYFAPNVPIENQLGTGAPMQSTRTTAHAKPTERWERATLEAESAQTVRRTQPALTEDYQELDTPEVDNWGEAQPVTNEGDRYGQNTYVEEFGDLGDAWADEVSPKSYQPQKLNLPKKVREPEYEEEQGYES